MGVKWYDFTLALIGTLPFMVTTIFLGGTTATVRDATGNDQDITNIVSLSVGCSVSVMAVGCIWYFARKELRQVRHIEISNSQKKFFHEGNDM